MAEHTNCQGYNALDKRLIKVETEQDAMKGDIQEIKQNQKEARTLAMTTLVTSVLSLISILISVILNFGG